MRSAWVRYAFAAPDGLARTGFTCPVCHRQITTGVEGLFDNPARGGQQRSCRQAATATATATATTDH